MKILVALLGLAPGTVTGVFYALQREGYGIIDRVVTLTTNSPDADTCERLIREELERWQQQTGGKVSYKPERITARDLEDVSSTNEFQDRIARILQRERMGGRNQVFLSVAGGRKSMAALAVVAAQLHPPDRMFHLYVSDELERQGDIHNLQMNPGLIEKCLRPEPSDYTLVEIPFFAIEVFRVDDVSPQQFRLILQGKANRFVAEYAQQHPEVLKFHPQTEHLTNLQARLFEIEVANYLRKAADWDSVESQYYVPGRKGVGDIDVYAERVRGYEREILICECKLFTPEVESPSLPLDKVRQLLHKARALEEMGAAQGIDFTLEKWVITNASDADEDAKRLAAENDVRLMHARLPRGWDLSADWKIQELKPMGD